MMVTMVMMMVMMVMMGVLAELPNQTPTKIPIRATLRWGCWALRKMGNMYVGGQMWLSPKSGR